MPKDPEGLCFFGGSTMKVEPNYEAESFTWRAYLQRVRKYADTNHVVEMFTMGDKIFRSEGVYKYINGSIIDDKLSE